MEKLFEKRSKNKKLFQNSEFCMIKRHESVGKNKGMSSE